MTTQNGKLISVADLTKKFKKTEMYGLFLIVPLVAYVIMITGNYTGSKIKPLLIDALIISVVCTIIHSALRKSKLKYFADTLNNGDNSRFSKLKGDILSFAGYDAAIVTIRWFVSPFWLLAMLYFQIDISRLNLLSVFIIIFLVMPFSYFLFYLGAENAMCDLLSDPRMTVVTADEGSYKSFNLLSRIFLFVASVGLLPLGILSFFLYLLTTNQLILANLGFHLLFITILAGLCLNVALYEMGISTKRSVSSLVSALENIKDGNLKFEPVPMLTANELGNVNQHVNALLFKLQEVVNGVKNTSDLLFLTSDDINKASYSLSSAASEQAAGVEEISSTMEEMLSSVSQNAENSNEADHLSETSFRLAGEGTEIVNNAVLAINEVKESSKKISEIITLINDIAFQTNLLALNAAVEAARAGDSGRGFAVVATEVRNLAQRSRGASDEIGKLIKTSVEKVNTGTDLVNKSGLSLKEIFNSIEKTKFIITEINTISKEQKNGLGEITLSLNQADVASQQTAAAAEELSSTADQLKHNSEEMQELMSFFKV